MKKPKNYWTRLLKVVRKEWSMHNEDRKACFKNAQSGKGDFKKWKCNNCLNDYALSDVQCDHKIHVGNTVPETILEFLQSFENLHSNNLQILCKHCHKMKTRQDVFNMKYREVVVNVSKYLEITSTFLIENVQHYKDLQKMDRAIRKIKSAYDNRMKDKYERQLNALTKKYL